MSLTNIGTDSSFTITMIYTGDVQSSVSRYGPGGIVQVSGTSNISGTMDNIKIAPNAEKVTLMQGASTGEHTIDLIKHGNDWTNEITINNFVLDSGGVASLMASEGDKKNQVITFTSSIANNGYSVKMLQSGITATAKFLVDDVEMNPGDTHIVIVDWNNISTATLKIDHDSDGDIDDTAILNNGAWKIYLPTALKQYQGEVSTPSAPDLTITGISYDDRTNSTTITVQNQGTQPSSHWFFVDLYVDRLPISRTDLGDYFGYGPSGLATNTSAQVTINDVNLSAGSHQLYAQVDTYDGSSGTATNGQIVESNEDNNTFGPVSVSSTR